MNFNPSCLLNKFLCCSNMKLPIGKCHYVTGRDISLFSKLNCVESTLTNLTCNCKNMYKSLGSGFRNR